MSDYSAPALSRSLAILEHLSQAGAPLMMSEIAALPGLSFNRLFRVMQCL
ncbi:helix-turn-helix domain-containing protein [Sodalis glossinidius]